MRSTNRSISPRNRLVRPARLALAVLAVAASLALAAEGPRDVVRRLADQAVAILKDKSLSSEERRDRLERLADSSVDFDTLSRLVLARNWNRFSPEEQQRFRDAFRRHLSVTYGKNIDSYRNETVQITSDREEARGDWTVKSKILRGGGDADVAVDYRLRQVNGEWKIIDFVVEGVSLVANFRSQFQDLLASDTPAQLIRRIQEKNERGEDFEDVKKRSPRVS